MSLTRVDLPDPLTPVTATKAASGNVASIVLRLFSLASLTTNCFFEFIGRLTFGIEIDFLPEIYAPVIDFLLLTSSS